jgi:hypothetical protein
MQQHFDHAKETTIWWLGLAIAITLAIFYTIPYPFGLVAIGLTFLIVGHVIPMRIIETHAKLNGPLNVYSSVATPLYAKAK